MPPSVTLRGFKILLYLATIVVANGNTVTSASQASPASSSSQNESVSQVYQKEQQALASEERSLINSGGTKAQLQQWRQSNATRFAMQQQRAQAISVASSAKATQEVQVVNVPANTDPKVKAFLTTRETLAANDRQAHNQLLQAESTQGGLQRRLSQAEARGNFERQNIVNFQLLAAQEKNLASSPTRTLLPVPAQTVVPPSTTPQLAAFLTFRDKLIREDIQMRNQYATASPAVRKAAMKNWRLQQKGQSAQMQLLLKNARQARSAAPNE